MYRFIAQPEQLSNFWQQAKLASANSMSNLKLAGGGASPSSLGSFTLASSASTAKLTDQKGGKGSTANVNVSRLIFQYFCLVVLCVS